jgi:hypothetical protein
VARQRVDKVFGVPAQCVPWQAANRIDFLLFYEFASRAPPLVPLHVANGTEGVLLDNATYDVTERRLPHAGTTTPTSRWDRCRPKAKSGNTVPIFRGITARSE